jgi:hypothetical protein
MQNPQMVMLYRSVDGVDDLIWTAEEANLPYNLFLKHKSNHTYIVNYGDHRFWGNIHEVYNWFLEMFNIDIVFDKYDIDLNQRIEVERKRKQEINDMNRRKQQ